MRVLLLDDEPQMCVSLSKILESHGIPTEYCTSAVDGLRRITHGRYDLIVSDLRMPELSGIDILEKITSISPETPTIIISGYASVENIVQTMKLGAANFYAKPLDAEKLVEEIKSIVKSKALASDTPAVPRIITQNEEMLGILDVMKTVAPTDAPVVITGESGTGKELVASAIHEMSDRADKPFVKLNCAAIPESLLESELFGYSKGAFTDAKEDRKGKFEMAEGGTIFLDEIGEMSIQTQAKLLRVVQEKEFERIGSNNVKKMDVRIISATNRNLEEMINGKLFRDDLFYRLSVITLELPPLRRRPEDIPLLAHHLLQAFNRKYHKAISMISEDVLSMFSSHEWPGNIRELKNCMERAVIFCNQPAITTEHLPEQYRKLSPAQNKLQDLYDSVTREVIMETLDKTAGSRQHAADLLNISRRTLYNKMKKLGID